MSGSITERLYLVDVKKRCHSIQEKIMLPFVSDLVLAIIEINFENIHESAVHHYAGTKSAMLELQTL